MKIVCIYHRIDLDGWCSAAIVNHFYRDKNVNLELIGWNYGDKIPDKVYKADKLILTDVSFPKEVMADLYEQYGTNFVWIDHHVSALKENDIDLISGIQNNEKAACELTWEFFFSNQKMPEFVWYLGMYDSFRHKNTLREADVLHFQYAARSLWTKPEDFEGWFDMDAEEMDDKLSDVLHLGSGIYRYLCVEAKQIYAKSFPIEIAGYKFLAVNRERFNPINFGINYHNDGYDGFVCYGYDGKNWKASIYSDNNITDCSQIAKQYDGGGHFGASGFMIDNIENFIQKHKI